jgi:hypothetical protein
VELVLEGGTHNPFAPPFPFIERAFLPLLLTLFTFIYVNNVFGIIPFIQFLPENWQPRRVHCAERWQVLHQRITGKDHLCLLLRKIDAPTRRCLFVTPCPRIRFRDRDSLPA